jgi:RNA polymerase sigma-70 factor (ECF subfamily)
MTQHCDIQTLYTGFSTKLRSYILHKVNDKHLAEDILHDTFIKIETCCKQDRSCDSPKSYLFQVADNTIADHYRKAKKNVTIPKDDNNVDENFNEELLHCLTPFLKQLPVKYLEALVLADIQQKKQQEVADLLNISLSGAKSRIQRAREKLKEIFVKSCHIQSDKYGNILNCEYKECKK